MRRALAFHLKSKVFNNVESPLKAQSSIQALRLSTMLGKVKGTACSEQRLWRLWTCVCVCE